MSVISFPFVNLDALRVANIITGDIEKLERAMYGTVTNWQTKFERPFKAHYANDLIRRMQTPAHRVALENNLSAYEKRAKEYTDNPQKRGRPLTTFVNMEDPTVNQTNQEPEAAEQADDLTTEIEAILSNDIPIPTPQSAKRSPAANKGAASTDIPPDAQNALAALMAALTPKPQAAEIDEERVREIARDEAQKTISPTIVTVHHVDPDGTTTAVELGVQHCLFPTLVKTMQAKFPVWMPGPAGSGKTTAAKHAAKALDVPFHHTGAVDNVYQLLGFIDAGGTYHRTTFREAYEHGGVFLWDEVDASNPAAAQRMNMSGVLRSTRRPWIGLSCWTGSMTRYLSALLLVIMSGQTTSRKSGQRAKRQGLSTW